MHGFLEHMVSRMHSLERMVFRTHNKYNTYSVERIVFRGQLMDSSTTYNGLTHNTQWTHPQHTMETPTTYNGHTHYIQWKHPLLTMETPIKLTIHI